MSWTSPRPVPWAGWAVRRDWPDGSHQFVRFEVAEELARAFIPEDVRYWGRGRVRPRHSVVVISVRDFELHLRRGPCRAPDCPQSPDVSSVSALVDGSVS